MALWQYTFQILTKESYEALYKNFVFTFEDLGFDSEPFWQYHLIDRAYFSSIESFLKKNQSWSRKIDLYGNQEGNCFEVSFNDDDYVLSVDFRIDFRYNYESVLKHIIEFCILKGLIFLDENLNYVPLNFETTKKVISNAPQVKKYNILSGNK